MVFPLRDSLFPAFKEFVHGPKIYFIWTVFLHTCLNHFKDSFRNIQPFLPLFFKPSLQLIYILIMHDVQLYVFGQAGMGKIAGPDKRISLRSNSGDRKLTDKLF